MSPTTAERQGLLGLRLQGITLGASQRQPGRMWGGLLPLGVACVSPAEADLQHQPHRALSPPALQLKLKVKVAQSCPTLQPHGLYSPWNSTGQNTGVGSRSLLQGIFPTQGSNPGLLHCR